MPLPISMIAVWQPQSNPHSLDVSGVNFRRKHRPATVARNFPPQISAGKINAVAAHATRRNSCCVADTARIIWCKMALKPPHC